jgi:hypothetical protein
MRTCITGQKGAWANKEHRKAYQSEQDAFEHNFPSIPEILKLVGLHPSILDCDFAESLEQSDEDADEEAEDNKEDGACQKYVGLLDTGSEANPIDTSHDNHLGILGNVGIAICPFVQDLILSSRIDIAEHIQRSLLDLNRSGRKG